MPTTSNFGWTTPADTDLVKDGAAAIRTLGNGIDTSLVDLKGGTTGQNLRKASNTDLDFTFAGDATNTVVDAAGDLLYGTANDTLGRLAIGTAGQVLKVNSGATAPEWGAASGGMTLITSGNLGTGGVSLTSITGAYTDLYLYIYGVKFDTSGKYIGVWADGSASSLRVTQLINTTAETSTYIRFGSSQQYLSGVMALGVLFKNYTNATGRKPIFYAGSSNDGTNDNELVGGGMANLTAAITRLDVENAVGGGNITAGSYELWGIK